MTDNQKSSQKKKGIHYFNEQKRNKEKISFITAYDAPTGRIAHEAGIDMILVGDSVGNNVLGYDSTIPVTMDDMIRHASAVRRGAPYAFIIGDMPIGSYQPSNEEAIRNAIRFIQDARMDAVKCEGGIRMQDRVKAIADSGIAVMGHIGYTPQSTNLEGIVHSKTLAGLKSLLKDARALEKAGAFAILLEAVPNISGGKIAKELKIPIYGIGAGREVDGVLAIVNDVIDLGKFKSRFVKRYGNVEEVMRKAISAYREEVVSGQFPDDSHCYSLTPEQEAKIKGYKSKKS